jgi:hypothetical protein
MQKLVYSTKITTNAGNKNKKIQPIEPKWESLHILAFKLCNIARLIVIICTLKQSYVT